MEILHDDFASAGSKWTVTEASGIVDGYNIIGRINGPFFVPNGVSRNKRFYSQDVWNEALGNKEVAEKIEKRRLLGTIGHKIPINDESLAEGKISHVISQLTKDGNGEALILNTPVGRILNTVMRAGVGLYSSSRANGDYKGTFSGVPAVDPQNFKLEGFDFVLEPGFLQANPKIVESFEKDDLKKFMELMEDCGCSLKEEKPIEEAKPKEENKPTEEAKKDTKPSSKGSDISIKEEVLMDEKLFEKVAGEKIQLQDKLTEALKELEKIKGEHVVLGSETTTLRQQNKELETKLEKLAKYEDIGTPEDIENAIDISEKVIWKYKQSGSPDEVSKALDKSYDEIKAYRELGTPAEIGKAFEKAEALITKYRGIGTIAELNEALDMATSTFKKFQEFGSPAEINLALDKAMNIAKGVKADKFNKRVESLSTELGVSPEVVKPLAQKMTDTEVRNLVKGLTESKKLEIKYRIPKGKTVNEHKNTETKPAHKMFEKSRGQSLMESFSNVREDALK